MERQPQPPVRLASEDVIINAPMSYAGSAQRIMRLRRRAPGGASLAAITASAVALVIVVWVFVTAWYLLWGIWLVPYRLLRRGARKRKVARWRRRRPPSWERLLPGRLSRSGRRATWSATTIASR
jgi:hypothetical protein